MDDNGYWVVITKDATMTRKPSPGLVRSVYHYWHLNIQNIQNDVQEHLVSVCLKYNQLLIFTINKINRLHQI